MSMLTCMVFGSLSSSTESISMGASGHGHWLPGCEQCKGEHVIQKPFISEAAPSYGCFLFFRSKSRNPALTEGEGIPQGEHSGGGGPLGVVLVTAFHTHLERHLWNRVACHPHHRNGGWVGTAL